MKKLAALAGVIAALTAAAPAMAAGPHLAPSDRRAINATLDVFVNHAVKRHDPGAAFGVVTPSLRGGMSRSQWAHGDIPVYPYPAAGRHFHQWTIQYRTSDELAIELILSPTARHRAELGQILFNVYLHPGHGRWFVDSFMPGATFAPVGKPAVVQAAKDFTANPSAQTYNRPGQGTGTGRAQVSSDYIFVPFAVIGLLLTGLAGWGVIRWVRARRLDVPAARALPPSPLSIRADGARARTGNRS